MLNIEKPDKNHPCNGCHYWRWIGICQACNYSLLTVRLVQNAIEDSLWMRT